MSIELIGTSKLTKGKDIFREHLIDCNEIVAGGEYEFADKRLRNGGLKASIAAAPLDVKSAAKTSSEKEDDDTNDEIDTELDAMTVDQLLVYGNNPETFNLDLKKSLGKVAILDAIVAAEKAKGVA